MSEFGAPDPERVVPHRFKVFSEAMKRYKELMTEAAPALAVAGEGYESWVPLSRNSQTLVLETVGCDTVVPVTFGVVNFTRDLKDEPSVDNFQALALELELFADRSPFVAEGDSLDIRDPNHYMLFVGREMPPTIVQSGMRTMYDAADPGVWHESHKLTLNDADSQRVLALLPELKVDFDAIPSWRPA